MIELINNNLHNLKMKKYIVLLCFFLIFTINCEKQPINIILWDKPLETILQNISGKWILMYGKGGLCGSCTYPCENCYIEFIGNNRFKSNGFLTTLGDVAVVWVKDKGEWLNGDSTYLMTFVEKNKYPAIYAFDQIKDGILTFYENGPDGMFYYCKRPD